MAAPLMEHMDHPMEVAPSKHQLHRMEAMAHPTEPLPRKHHQEILQLMGHPLHHPMVPQERLNRRQEGLRDPTLEQRQRHPCGELRGSNRTCTSRRKWLLRLRQFRNRRPM